MKPFSATFFGSFAQCRAGLELPGELRARRDTLSTNMATIVKSAAVVLPPSPSPFACLLRRSKFASYDPTICQVYTTYDGNAYRGNWGFKRPLALRKRDKFISVEAVDSPEQQTEWSPRESEARFIKRWEEVAPEPIVREAWDNHCTSSRPVHQAELAKEDQNGNIVDPAVQRQLDESPNKQYVAPVPLVSSMPTRVFNRYLDKLRQQRPEFLEFLSQEAQYSTQTQAAPRLAVSPSAYEQSALGSAEMVRRRFLQKQSHTIYESPDSRAIEQRPHRNGGLSYSHTSQLTHFFTTTKQPGRLLEKNSKDRRGPIQASFAGMAVNVKPPIYHTEGESKLRVVETVLKQAPSVVAAQPQGLDDAIIDTSVVDVVNLDMMRANPFPPGSRAYIAHGKKTIALPKGKRSLTAPRSKEADREGKEVSKELLNTLRGIMQQFDKSAAS